MHKTIKNLIVLFLMTCVVCGFFIQTAEAASTKTVYIVTGIMTECGDSKTTTKLIYNKDGLLTKRTDSVNGSSTTETFTYDESKQLKKYVFTDSFGNKKTNNYKWKNGSILKCKGIKDVNDYSWTFNYNSKKQMTDSLFKAKSSSMFGVIEVEDQYKYKYSKGKLVGIEDVYTTSMGTSFETVTTIKYDEKGNISKIITGRSGEPKEKETHKLFYDKNNRVSRLEYKDKNYTDKTIMKFSYKKITVKATNLAYIADQQWKLINNVEKMPVVSSYLFNPQKYSV